MSKKRVPRIKVPTIGKVDPKVLAERKKRCQKNTRKLLKLLRREGLIPKKGKGAPTVNLFDIFLPHRPQGIKAERKKLSPKKLGRLMIATADMSREDLSEALAHLHGKIGQNQYDYR